ncbi:hypothetical protein ABZ532_14740 [Streptomyces sp. NPDC019396]|uniref:hypothetical protein n=1 Tax=Streptomyces sp. NPDC019396 TaxID=3154687 RepID=UPI0033DC85CB
MRLTMPSGTPEGIPLTVMPFREDAVIGTMSLATLVRLVPSPRQERRTRAPSKQRPGTTGATPSCGLPCSGR